MGANRDYNYNNKAWQQSQLLAALAALPPEVRIYTNEPQGVYFHLGRTALSVPTNLSLSTGQQVSDFAARVSSITQQAEQGKAVVAYFRLHNWTHFAPEEDLEHLAGLIKLKETDDGAIYGSETLRKILSP